MKAIVNRYCVFHVALSLLCGIIFFLIIHSRDGTPFLRQKSYLSANRWSPRGALFTLYSYHRRLTGISIGNYSNATGNMSTSTVDSGTSTLHNPTIACSGISEHVGFENQCQFLKSHPRCSSGAFIDYIGLFYCGCEKFHVLGYATLVLWLVGLFYMLGNTAADYFCCSLEKLSTLLRLPPTVAGVTLLPLGNGAPDVFASIASFVGAGAGDVGINSALGAAVFVTCVVVGVVSLCVADRKIQINKRCFFRDVGFFILSVVLLSLIIYVGKITVLGALSFVMVYFLYAFVAVAKELLKKRSRALKADQMAPLLPAWANSSFSQGIEDHGTNVSMPESDTNVDVSTLNSLPHWIWTSNAAIYSNHNLGGNSLESSRPLWGWAYNRQECRSYCSKFFLVIGTPLILPRRLTIPIVEEERWSKGFAVCSAVMAPILLATLLSNQRSRSTVYVCLGGAVGVILGALAFSYTRSDEPPRRFLFPWVFGGFVMSITWFYIIANELVTLLVSLGVIFGINPGILALTVLAWGNSMGDLISNVSLAKNSRDGLQIAMSGCYAGPMFNTLAGLGVSMLLAASKVSPKPYVLPHDDSLVFIIGFLLCGLLWALCILPINDMRPNKVLGVGLIGIYVIFLSVRLVKAVGVLF